LPTLTRSTEQSTRTTSNERIVIEFT